MRVIETELRDVIIIKPTVYKDHRGYFMETHKTDTYQNIGIPNVFIQDNFSCSYDSGTIRGLHYQLSTKSQTKLVQVLSGAIFDVVIDLRKNSPTFRQWTSVILSEDNKWQLLVPKGFAHGFCSLVSNTKVYYKVDQLYDKELERGILWCDPDLNIKWPTKRPILSKKDEEHPLFRDIGADDIYSITGGKL